MKTDIHTVLNVVTQRMPEAGIPCLMIGGHAVNHYGVVRATQDVDFMIASSKVDVVKRVMRDAGFTNISEHETVMFFNYPDSPLRVDFLKVESETMEKLLSNAVSVQYARADKVLVPQLNDLLAMKLFALSTGSPKRRDKDFGDIVNLVIENAVDVEAELQPLCEKYGTDSIYEQLRVRIEELRHA